MNAPLPHPPGTQYMIEATTKEVAETGLLRMTVVTLGHEVLAMDESTRVDLCDHPLYPQLERYVRNNPSRKT